MPLVAMHSHVYNDPNNPRSEQNAQDFIAAISKELADATCEAFDLQPDGSISADIVGLDRHGVIAVARDPWTAFEHIERLEHICQIVLVSGVGKSLGS